VRKEIKGTHREEEMKKREKKPTNDDKENKNKSIQ
jgi:hypothetical protein